MTDTVKPYSEQSHYRYPDSLTLIAKSEPMNGNQQKPVYCSMLTNDRGDAVIDIRLWIEDRPTRRGVFLNESGARRLTKQIMSYIDNDVVEQLGYDPFKG